MRNKSIKTVCIVLAALLLALLCVCAALGGLITRPQSGIYDGAQGGELRECVSAAVSAGILDDARQVLSGCIGDVDGDKQRETVLLLTAEGKAYGDRVLLLTGTEKPTVLFSGSFARLQPWKVLAGDVDGDGIAEISLGVYTVAKFHPTYAKRPFVYNFTQGDLYPKWLGSRLSRPFDDYVLSDVNGDGKEELISIENNGNSKKELNVYHWKGFGFESLGVSAAEADIAALCADPGGVTARALKGLLWTKKRYRFSPDQTPVLIAD